jgi:hypothetical protein
MRLSELTEYVCMLGLITILIGPSARGDQVWTVSLDTSRVAANYSGPFALDFELVGSNRNTITLNDFSFGSAGNPGPGLTFLTGGASGDLGTSVILDDTANFFSDFNQQFIPGNTLTFTVDSTLVAPPMGGFPDSFSMVIFQDYDPVNGYDPTMGTGGTPIPTADPSGADTFLSIDVNGPGLTAASSYTDLNGYVPITISPASVVPEPSSGLLMIVSVIGVSSLLLARRDRIGAMVNLS